MGGRFRQVDASVFAKPIGVHGAEATAGGRSAGGFLTAKKSSRMEYAVEGMISFAESNAESSGKGGVEICPSSGKSTGERGDPFSLCKPVPAPESSLAALTTYNLLRLGY
jgi:hypothetical protein